MARALEQSEAGLRVEIVPIGTSGDERPGSDSAPPADGARRPPQRSAGGPAGDKSRFVKEIEAALIAEEIDLAVHSAKDVPGSLPEGLAIVGVPERADARDALCGAEALAALPEGAVVGTSSLRRRSQLLALRPDLRVFELRGNVDTRLGRLERGEYAAIVLAAAGLERLGRAPGASSGGAEPDGAPLPVAELTPAPGQGCLALEGRADDERARQLADRVTHHESLVRLTAERALIGALDASCRTPIGALCEIEDRDLCLSAFVGLPDGGTWIRDSATGAAGDPAALGRRAAERMLGAGAGELLAAAEDWDAGERGTSV